MKATMDDRQIVRREHRPDGVREYTADQWRAHVSIIYAQNQARRSAARDLGRQTIPHFKDACDLIQEAADDSYRPLEGAETLSVEECVIALHRLWASARGS